MNKSMTYIEFEEWWFDKNGEDSAFEEFSEIITEQNIRLQPSWRVSRNRENAICEAVWEKAYAKYVKNG